MSEMTNQQMADEIERFMLIEALDQDLLRLGVGNMISPRRLMREVDSLLRTWGRIYPNEDAREISNITKIKSIMGKIFKQNMGEVNVHDDVVVFIPNTERFEKINTAVNKMPQFYKEILRRHYIIAPETEIHRNDEPTKVYARRMKIPLSTYTDHLREGKQLFVAMGGI